MTHVLIVGDTDIARRACAALTAGPTRVNHLPHPSERELHAALAEVPDAVAVVVRGDVVALRYALLIEHARPGTRLIVTVFDATIATQLRAAVINCEVTSPAETAVPALVGACLGPGLLAADPGSVPLITVRSGPHGAELGTMRLRIGRRRLSGQLRAHDTTARVLLAGAAGLSAILVTDWLIVQTALHLRAATAVYAAVRVVATVGPGDATSDAPGWYLWLSSVFMVLTIGFTALLTAGLVNRLLSPRSIAIIGRRTMPTRDHVIVVGLGQVGLRLCVQLRRLGVRTVAVERDADAVNLRLARAAGIPVLIAHAEDRAVLQRLHLHHARALAAMSSDELDNVEVAIAALAVAPGLRVVIRAGENEIIDETRSLFHIGDVRDVSALTAFAIVQRMLDQPVGIVCHDESGVRNARPDSGTVGPGHAFTTTCAHRNLHPGAGPMM